MGVQGSKVEPTALLERTGLCGVSTNMVITRWWPAFRKACPRYAMGAQAFEELFGVTFKCASIDVLCKAFASLDERRRGIVDGLEVFAALVVFSQGKLFEKADALYTCFEFVEHGELDLAALGMMIERTYSGLRKTASFLEVTMPAHLPRALANHAFRTSGVDDDQSMPRAAFHEWWQRDSMVR
eukprot:5146117-Amphidinium_carterae.1